MALAASVKVVRSLFSLKLHAFTINDSERAWDGVFLASNYDGVCF